MLFLLLIITGYIFVYNWAMYFFARRFDVNVEKFYVWYDYGFRFFKFKLNGTEFGLGWLPLGGYVKLVGMILNEGEEIKPNYFLSLSRNKRITVFASGAVFCLILGLGLHLLSGEVNGLNLPVVSGLSVGIIVYVFIISSIIKRKRLDAEHQLQNGLGFIGFLTHAIFIFLCSYLIFEATPFFEDVKSFWNGEVKYDSFEITAQNWKSIAGNIGIVMFVLNILPLSGMNGLNMMLLMNEGITGKMVREKWVMVYNILLFPVVLFCYGWMIYQFFW